MGRQGHDAAAAATPSMRMQRSQSRISLSASFEALAVYFPCMNSFEEDDGGKTARRASPPVLGTLPRWLGDGCNC